MFDLGEAIKNNKQKVELEQYKGEILYLKQTLEGLTLEKQSLLEVSLENRLLMEVYSYLIWMIAEKKIQGEWKRLWPSYDIFMSCQDLALVGEISKYAAMIIGEELHPSIK